MVSLYAFDRDFLYLSFDNDTHVIMSFGNDIRVFMYMNFVLMDLFNEWVYSFYNGGYLSSEDLRVLAF